MASGLWMLPTLIFHPLITCLYNLSTSKSSAFTDFDRCVFSTLALRSLEGGWMDVFSSLNVCYLCLVPVLYWSKTV